MLTVSECLSYRELEPLRAEWEALLERSTGASVFATWEWVAASVRHPAAGKRPAILLVRDGAGVLQAALPLARTRRFGVFNAVEVLGCARDGYPLADYGGLVAAPGFARGAWIALLRHLGQQHWSVLDLRNCMPDQAGEMRRTYSQLPGGASWELHVGSAEVCRRLPLAPTFDGYLAGLSANARQNLRRKLRKLAQDGYTVEQVDASDTMWREAALRVLFDLHQARWAADPSGGAFPDQQAREFHLEAARLLAAAGRLDLRVVRDEAGAIGGVIYNLRYGGCAYFYQLGWSDDPRWAPYSLGTCLLASSIAAACADGCHTFDLLRGDHDYKRHFGGVAVPNLRVTIYRNRWLPRTRRVVARLHQGLRAHPAPLGQA